MEETIIISFVKTTDEPITDFVEGLRDFIQAGYDDEIEELRIITEEVGFDQDLREDLLAEAL